MWFCCWIFCNIPCVAKVAGKIFSMSNDIFAGCHHFFFFLWGCKEDRDLAKDVSVLLGFSHWFLFPFPRFYLAYVCLGRLYRCHFCRFVLHLSLGGGISIYSAYLQWYMTAMALNPARDRWERLSPGSVSLDSMTSNPTEASPIPHMV